MPRKHRVGETSVHSCFNVEPGSVGPACKYAAHASLHIISHHFMSFPMIEVIIIYANDICRNISFHNECFHNKCFQHFIQILLAWHAGPTPFYEMK